MKNKGMLVIVVLVLSVLMAIPLIGCSPAANSPQQGGGSSGQSETGGDAVQSGGENSDIVIGHLLYYRQDEYEVAMERAVYAECEKRGWGLINHDANADSAKQLQQFEDLVTQKVDMIVVCPVDAEGLGPTAEKAIAQGIPVLTYDEPLNAEGIVTWVQSDDVSRGVDLAEWLKKYADENWGGQAQVAQLITAGSTADALRFSGFNDNIDNDNIKVITVQDGKSSRSESLTVTENIMTGNPNVNVYLCSNDESALGAVQALEAAQKKDIIVMSMGPWTIEVVNRMKNQDPFFKATIITSPFEMQRIVFEKIDIYFAGGTVDPIVIMTPQLYDQVSIMNFDLSQMEQ